MYLTLFIFSCYIHKMLCPMDFLDYFIFLWGLAMTKWTAEFSSRSHGFSLLQSCIETTLHGFKDGRQEQRISKMTDLSGFLFVCFWIPLKLCPWKFLPFYIYLKYWHMWLKVGYMILYPNPAGRHRVPELYSSNTFSEKEIRGVCRDPLSYYYCPESDSSVLWPIWVIPTPELVNEK